MKKIRSAGLVLLVFALSMLFSAAAGADAVPIDAGHFPDGAFRAYVQEAFDTDADGSLSDAERSGVTSIAVNERGIKDLSGIALFPEVRDLICSGNKLKKLDLRENQELCLVVCDNNQLTELTLGSLPRLAVLDCSSNKLQSLDLSGCDSLASLYISFNELLCLDVSRNTAIGEISCLGNKRTFVTEKDSFDLSAIEGFRADKMNVTDLSGCTVSDGKVIFDKPEASVTYSYDCGMGYGPEFTMEFSVQHSLVLPASLKVIHSKAFANLDNVFTIELPASLTEIADDAFSGTDVVFIAEEGSYAEQWLILHCLEYRYKNQE